MFLVVAGRSRFATWTFSLPFAARRGWRRERTGGPVDEASRPTLRLQGHRSGATVMERIESRRLDRCSQVEILLHAADGPLLVAGHEADDRPGGAGSTVRPDRCR